jgi:type IV secretory pathway VirD2 relaxase
MSNPEFEPRIGKLRSRRETRSGLVRRMVIKTTMRQRAHESPWADALTRRPVAELGRGKGALYGLTPPPRGWRRVTVKARIARHGTSDLAAARTHQHYIMRDGVTRVGGPGQLYDREHNVAAGGDFLERQKGDTYQFRLIVAPEDGGRMADLKPFVRDLKRNMEEDLATRLDWVAADHFNTGHPHTHIVIAGHDDRGQDLVMARHYISHGIRHRAQDLVTLELGPEQPLERVIKLANEMKAERFTSLDRGILRDAKENVVVVSSTLDDEHGPSVARAEGAQLSMRVGRLRRLEQMGLAEEKRTGVWAIDSQLETKLRSLGERGDIMVIMNQVMRAHGVDRPAGDFAIFSGAQKSEPVIGRVVEVSIADEMTDRKYLIVDSIDGRIHYAETGKLAGPDLLEPGMMVALSGGGGKGKMRNARIEVLSYWPVERLAAAEAATWLDQAIVADKKPIIHEKGFGAVVSKALIAREEWLIANRHASVERPGTITPNPDMLRALNNRGITVAAEKMSGQLGMPHHSLLKGIRMTGKHVGTIDLPMQRLAVIKGRQEFTLIPWRPELLKMHGKEIDITVRGHTITMALARGRVRGLGLSR